MAANKKKIVAFLGALALGSVILTVCSIQSTPAEQAKPLFNHSSSPFANDLNFSAAPANSPSTRELFFKMMLSVLLVVVLGTAAIYTSKKFLPRIANLPGKEIHIIETARLGPHKAVHLLKIGNQQLLIGSTNQSITKLADISGAAEHNQQSPFRSAAAEKRADAFLETDLSSREINDNLRI